MSDYSIVPPGLALVHIGSKQEQAASPPEPAPGTRGVWLNGPQRLRDKPGRSSLVPVCGLYSVPVEDSFEQMALLHLRISGLPPIAVQPIGLGDPEDEETPGSAERPGGREGRVQIISGYFAVDLGPYIKLPPHPARVEYAIEFGGHTSAVHSFEWQPVLPPEVPARG